MKLSSLFPALAACLVSSLLLSATAQEAKPTAAILAGKLIDVKTGKAREHAYIVIAGDRVQAIQDQAPAGVAVTDL
ncbi:MAG TPA: hypothetical protein VIM62_04115, partial [Acidobacteriaceae bacterium]